MCEWRERRMHVSGPSAIRFVPLSSCFGRLNMGQQPLHDGLVAEILRCAGKIGSLAENSKGECNCVRRMTSSRFGQSEPLLEYVRPYV
jgi:hypothetical protein